MQPLDLVPVYSAGDPVQAHVVKDMLEEEDIRAFIEDENQGALPTMGVEVRVLVPSDRAEEARKLIEEHEALVRADAEKETDEDEGEEESPPSGEDRITT
jgi:hypothetical protein